MNSLDIKELIDSHIEKVHDFMYKTSDIIKIMDFIMNEVNLLDAEIKKIVDNFDESLFFILEVMDLLDKIKELESGVLEVTLNKVNEFNEDFSVYLNTLAEKRIINNLDKTILLSFTNLLMRITYTNSYTNYITKRIDNYKSKIYKRS